MTQLRGIVGEAWLMFEIVLMVAFGLGAVGIVVVVGIGIVNWIRGRHKDDWRDDLKPGDGPKLTPGNYPAPPWG
jgi:hypothetical protein